MAAAADGLFPAVFARLSRRGVPAVGIVISVGLATVLVLIGVLGGDSFTSVYDMIVSLSTMAAVIPYVFCALAPALIAARTAAGGKVPRIGLVEGVAFVFSLFTVYGCGPQPVLFGLLLLLLGIPVYVWQQREHATVTSVDHEAPSPRARVKAS
jgi:arginine:agmatine antiporter